MIGNGRCELLHCSSADVMLRLNLLLRAQAFPWYLVFMRSACGRFDAGKAEYGQGYVSTLCVCVKSKSEASGRCREMA